MNLASASEHPLVSVVIPAYNSAAYIGAAIDSVLEQDYPAIEVCVVDDGSTDGTADVVTAFGDPVNYVKQKNAGAATARNEGMRRAKGEYIAFLDSDDLWLPGKLRLQVEHLGRHREVGMCCSRWDLLYPDEHGAYHFVRPPALDSVAVDPEWHGWIYHQLLLSCEVCTITVIMRRSLAQQVGKFYPALRRGQDYDYWLRASRLTRIDRLDAPMAVYRMNVDHDQKYPETNWGVLILERAIEQWGLAGPDGRRADPAAICRRFWELNYQFGCSQFESGRYGPAARAFRAALRCRPAHLKTLLYAIAGSVGSFAMGARVESTELPQ